MSSDPERIQSATGAHLWLVLWKAYTSVREYATANIASLGIGMSDFATLEVLLHKGPTPVNAIGAAVGLTSGSISVAVDRLESRGLVERRGDPEDRRARVVHLTLQGRELIECAFEAHSRALDDLASVLTVQERDEAIRLLKMLGKAAEAAQRKSRRPAQE